MSGDLDRRGQARDGADRRTGSGLLYLDFDVYGDQLDAARACEQDVFLQAFGNTAEQLADEYGPYEDQSTFSTVSTDTGEVIGACRIIVPGPAGLKTLNDTSRDPWNVDGYRALRAAGVDPDVTYDVATLGVRREFRGQSLMVSLALFHAVIMTARTPGNGLASAVAIMDDGIWRILTSTSFHFYALPGTTTAPYLGSGGSTPVYTTLTGIMDRQRRENPDAFRLMTLGVGMDGVALPDPDSFLIVRRAAEIAS